MKDNNIPPSNVLRHEHIAPDRKWDVWPEFYKPYGNWKDFQDLLSKDTMDKTQILTLKWMIWQYKMLRQLDEDNRDFYAEQADAIRDLLERNWVDTSDT